MAVKELHFTESDEANRLLVADPMALLIGFALDQQVTVQKAFMGPLVLKERLGAIVVQIAALDRAIAEIEDRRDEAMRAQRDLAEGGSVAYAQSFKALSDLLARADVLAVVTEARTARKGRIRRS